VCVVGSLGYVERVRTLPASFTVSLAVEPANRYFPHAIAVLASGEKVGYVAPEVASRIFDQVKAAPAPIACSARRAGPEDHASSGVEILIELPAGLATD
jgi:hypothetical protein